MTRESRKLQAALRIHQVMRELGLQPFAGQPHQAPAIDQRLRQGQPRQCDAQTLCGGLVQGLGIVESGDMPRRRLAAERGEPILPTLGRIAQQRQRGDLRKRRFAVPLHEGGTGDRRDPFVEQEFGLTPGPLAGAQAQGGVDRLAFEVDHVRARLQAEAELRMARQEFGQPRHQPRRGHRRDQAERQQVVGARAEPTHGVLDGVDRLGHRIEQALPLRSQHHAARAARQQLLADAFFQQAHAMAQGADGQVHGFGRAGQVAQTGGDDEGVYLVQRRAAHLEFTSSLTC